MYSDLFDQLGGGARGSGRSSSAAAAAVEEPAPLIATKAGKITLIEPKDDASSYKCVADTARGEIRLVTKNTELQWQWYDRRRKTVVDTIPIDSANFTFERVELHENKKIHQHDRVYVLTHENKENVVDYHMYWMQDADDSNETEIVDKIRNYLAHPESATTTGPPESSGAAAASSGATNQSQVDALSSILENLGMPASQQGTASSSAITTAAATNTGTITNQLTLADLQGAMAGIQQQPSQQQQQPGPPLQDVVDSTAVQQLLLEDDAVKARLIALLPEEQQSEEYLRDNLQSPALQSTLRALTQALLPDDHGDLSGYASVIANFQLDAANGEASLAAGNPIAAFLDCIVKSVEKEDDEESKEEEEDNENQDGNEES